MITLRPSQERGQAHHGWLQSQHSFSFANYYDENHMGVSALRVINDDKVAPGRGFATHSHQDMEIISYVKHGTIEHKDSMGNIKRLPAGEFQLMSAGKGITHSEYNPSTSDSLEFLQIWVEPNVYGIQPGYQQKKFESTDGMQLIASANAREDSLLIHQDADIYHLQLKAEHKTTLSVAASRTVYVHMVRGQLKVNGKTLQSGDGATITNEDQLEFISIDSSEALVFDLP